MGGARPVRRPRMRAGAPVLCPSCGQTVLSRYDVDPLCDVCMRKVRAAPPAAWGPPTWLWDSGRGGALAGAALDDSALAGYEPSADVPPSAGVVEDAGVDLDRRGFGGLATAAVAIAALPAVAVPARVSLDSCTWKGSSSPDPSP